VHVSSVLSVFRRMLQIFHLVISKVDRMLLLGTHLAQSERGSKGGACGLHVGVMRRRRCPDRRGPYVDVQNGVQVRVSGRACSFGG
jgi:hypothetical protein